MLRSKRKWFLGFRTFWTAWSSRHSYCKDVVNDFRTRSETLRLKLKNWDLTSKHSRCWLWMILYSWLCCQQINMEQINQESDGQRTFIRSHGFISHFTGFKWQMAGKGGRDGAWVSCKKWTDCCPRSCWQSLSVTESASSEWFYCLI